MMTMLDKPILEFVENEVDFHRLEMVHGTLYAKLKNDTDCGILHEKLEKFYRKNINPAGAVNMYFVGDDFAFDFVPEDAEKKPDPEDESPAFPSYEEKGVWSEFAEEEQYRNMPDEVDLMLNLLEEQKKGK